MYSASLLLEAHVQNYAHLALPLILSISQLFDALGLGRTYEDSGVYGQVRAPSGGLQVGAPSLCQDAPVSY